MNTRVSLFLYMSSVGIKKTATINVTVSIHCIVFGGSDMSVLMLID